MRAIGCPANVETAEYHSRASVGSRQGTDPIRRTWLVVFGRSWADLPTRRCLALPASGRDYAAASQPRQKQAQGGADELAATAAEERDADEELRHELGDRRARAEPEVQEERDHVRTS